MRSFEIGGLEYRLYMADGSEGADWKAGLWYGCPSDYDEAQGPWIIGQETPEKAMEVCESAIGHDERATGGKGTTARLTGMAALEWLRENPGRRINKWADPTDGHRMNIDLAEAERIAAKDPNLLWVHP